MPDRDKNARNDDFRSTVAHRMDEARDAASRAYDRTRESARDTIRRTSASIDANPLSMLVGGAALGVLISAVVPRSKQEKKLLKPAGERLAAGVAMAAEAARDAGKRELEGRGLTKDGARDQVRQLFDSVVGAATKAGEAAVKGSKEARTQGSARQPTSQSANQA